MEHTFNSEQMYSIDSLQPDFHAVIQRLEGVVALDIINQLKSMQKKVTDALRSYNKAEEDNWQKNSDALEIISKENNFKTVWSMEEVPASQMNEIIPYKVTHMEYKGATTVIAGPITWLQSWKIANSLIKQSGYTDHIFIEMFEQLENGGVKIITGS